jgi:hypothetical protein
MKVIKELEAKLIIKENIYKLFNNGKYLFDL